MRDEQSPGNQWGITLPTNVWISEVPAQGRREKGAEKLYEEIMVGNFPNLIKI